MNDDQRKLLMAMPGFALFMEGKGQGTYPESTKAYQEAQRVLELKQSGKTLREIAEDDTNKDDETLVRRIQEIRQRLMLLTVDEDIQRACQEGAISCTNVLLWRMFIEGYKKTLPWDEHGIKPLKTYTVTCSATSYNSTDLEVEAANEDEAEEKATEIMNEGGLVFDDYLESIDYEVEYLEEKP